MQFIDSAGFMASSLSDLVNNLSKAIHKIKCKYGHDDKECEACGIQYEYCDCFFEQTNFKDDLIEYKCLCCNKSYQRKFDENLKERFFNTYKFSIDDNNKFLLLLQKGVYPYVYMDDWEKFNEISLPEKEDFYRHLNNEDFTDVKSKRVCKDFDIKNLGKYYGLYVQSDTLLLADVFDNFRNKCLEIYELDPAKFLSASGLAWQPVLKKLKLN